MGTGSPRGRARAAAAFRAQEGRRTGRACHRRNGWGELAAGHSPSANRFEGVTRVLPVEVALQPPVDRPRQELLMVRIVSEEQLLARELDGYEAYRGKVRYRLVPHVW